MAVRIQCKGCGKYFTAKSEYRKFCDAACYDRFHKIKNAPIPTEVACRFSDGVVCDKQECEKCGWNPEVAERRVAQIRERLEAAWAEGNEHEG